MPRLILYIPFPSGKDGDIQNNATDLENASVDDFKIGGDTVTEIVVVYLGEEGNNDVQNGDILCVHGHGGGGKYFSVTNNRSDNGSVITLNMLTANLNTLHAERASRIYFFVCFSAVENHIAAKWKQDHNGQRVWGSEEVCQGGIISITRSKKIRSSIFADGNGQLTEL